MIYFAQPEEGGLIKIGCSDNVPLRLIGLSSQYGVRLVCLGVLDGRFEEEARIHRRFACLLVEGREWFRPDPVLLEFIRADTRPYEKDDGWDGPILAVNLIRLGFARTVVPSVKIASLVRERTGEEFAPQKVSAVLNAVRVNPETIELLARGLGVKAEELTRKPAKGKGGKP